MQWIFWIIAIILSSAAGYWVYLADKRRAVPHPWLTSLLRGLVVFFTLLLLLVPAIVTTKNEEEKPIVLLLQDNSVSVAHALGNDSAAYRKHMQALSARLAGKYKVVEWGFGGRVQEDSLYTYAQGATDIAAALERAQEYFGMQNLGAVVLATDGRYNQGANPAYQQLAMRSVLYTVPLGDSSRQKDMRVARVYANRIAAVNSSFEVRADIVAALCKGFNNNISITENGNVLSTVPLVVTADRYDRAASFTIQAAKAGLHHYILSVPDAGGEKNVANNRKDVFVEVVEEKKNILLAAAAPHPDVNAIRDALAGLDGYTVTVITGDNFPASLSAYNVIILHGLPSVRSNVVAQLLAARKPVWFVVSAQTSIANLNTLDVLTHTKVAPGMPHDVAAAYSSSFNAFTLPQQIQTVTDKLPPLLVNGGRIATAPGTNSLFTQGIGAGADQSPLWLLQQGSVPTAILLGEGIWRWRLHEYKNFNTHNVIDECIRQTVTFLAANNNEKPFNVLLPKHVWSDQEAIAMTGYVLNANNEQVNTPDVQLTVTDSAGRKQQFTFERQGTGYRLNIGLWAGGTYTYSATSTYNGMQLTANGSFVVERMPLELMETGADYPLMFGLARKYNGSLVTPAGIASLYDSITKNERVKPLIQTITETEPLVDRKWYFFVILMLAVAEWLLRKYWLAQ